MFMAASPSIPSKSQGQKTTINIGKAASKNPNPKKARASQAKTSEANAKTSPQAKTPEANATTNPTSAKKELKTTANCVRSAYMLVYVF